MRGKDDMEAKLESKTRLYNSEEEIKKDQEAVVNGVFDTNPDFAYLKENAELTDRVRTGCLEGIRKGTAQFMKEKGITDIRSVFDDYFNEFFYHDGKSAAIKDRLKEVAVLIKGLCGTEEDYMYECEHIAEVVDCEYVNEVHKKHLVRAGHITSSELEYVDMPEVKDKFDE